MPKSHRAQRLTRVSLDNKVHWRRPKTGRRAQRRNGTLTVDFAQLVEMLSRGTYEVEKEENVENIDGDRQSE